MPKTALVCRHPSIFPRKLKRGSRRPPSGRRSLSTFPTQPVERNHGTTRRYLRLDTSPAARGFRSHPGRQIQGADRRLGNPGHEQRQRSISLVRDRNSRRRLPGTQALGPAQPLERQRNRRRDCTAHPLGHVPRDGPASHRGQRGAALQADAGDGARAAGRAGQGRQAVRRLERNPWLRGGLWRGAAADGRGSCRGTDCGTGTRTRAFGGGDALEAEVG